jgi:hypothetical protein
MGIARSACDLCPQRLRWHEQGFGEVQGDVRLREADAEGLTPTLIIPHSAPGRADLLSLGRVRMPAGVPSLRGDVEVDQPSELARPRASLEEEAQGPPSPLPPTTPLEAASSDALASSAPDASTAETTGGEQPPVRTPSKAAPAAPSHTQEPPMDVPRVPEGASDAPVVAGGQALEEAVAVEPLRVVSSFCRWVGILCYVARV